MKAWEALSTLSAGGSPDAALAMSFGAHVLGIRGSATWTIVQGDGSVKERRSAMGRPAEPARELGKIRPDEVRALARTLVASNLPSVKPGPGPVNLRTTISVSLGEDRVHVDVPTPEIDSREELRAIKVAFDRARAAATSVTPAPVATPATPAVAAAPAPSAWEPPASGSGARRNLIVILVLLAAFVAGVAWLAVRRRQQDREFVESLGNSAAPR